jgi:hypothetical protein
MDDLALQIGMLDGVGIQDAERAHARSREIEQRRGSEPARADDEHAGIAQSTLTDDPDARKEQLARRPLHLVSAELRSGLDKWRQHRERRCRRPRITCHTRQSGTLTAPAATTVGPPGQPLDLAAVVDATPPEVAEPFPLPDDVAAGPVAAAFDWDASAEAAGPPRGNGKGLYLQTFPSAGTGPRGSSFASSSSAVLQDCCIITGARPPFSPHGWW